MLKMFICTLKSCVVMVGICFLVIGIFFTNLVMAQTDIILDEQWLSTGSWEVDGNGVEITQNSELLLSSDDGSKSEVTQTQPIVPSSYSLEFKNKILRQGTGDTQAGVQVIDTLYEMKLLFKSDGVYAYVSDLDPNDGIPTGTTSLKKIDGVQVDENWHTWEVAVQRGIALVYCDNLHVASLRLPETSEKIPIIKHWVDGQINNSIENYTEYTLITNVERSNTFSCNFEDPYAGDPDYWIPNGGQWDVLSDGATKVYRQSDKNSTDELYSLLHVFAKNVVFEGDFKVNDYNQDGAVWFTTRWNIEEYYLIKAGYNFSTGKWEIRERDIVIGESDSETISSGTWYSLKIVAEENTINLYVNDILKATAYSSHTTHGRVGLYTYKADVSFDNASYSGEGKVYDGVDYYTGFGYLGDKNFDMVELDNGNLYGLFNRPDVPEEEGTTSTMYETVSTDSGLTWSTPVELYSKTNTPLINKLTAGAPPNILKLNSGKLIFIGMDTSQNDRYLYKNYAMVSNDDGQTWNGPYYIQPNWTESITMNDKIVQTSGGRIFFTTGEGSGGLDAEHYGGLINYYSDDDGLTWTASQTSLNFSTFGMNLQSGKVVEIPNGELKMYMRTPYGFLYESLSTDNGVTWSTPKPTMFTSPLADFGVHKDSYSGYHYMFWTYDNTNDRYTPQHPREYLGLAVSKDGTQTWEYVMDVEAWHNSVHRYMNLGLYITEDYIFLHSPRYNVKDVDWSQRIIRVEKSKIGTTGKFLGTLHTPVFESILQGEHVVVGANTDLEEDFNNFDDWDIINSSNGSVEIKFPKDVSIKATSNGQTGINVKSSVLTVKDSYEMEFSLKRISGSTTVNVQTGNYRLNLTIRDNKIDTWDGSQHNIVKEMATDNEWHKYKLIVANDTVDVYMDNEHIGKGACEVSSTIAQNSPIRIYASLSGSESSLQYIKFKNIFKDDYYSLDNWDVYDTNGTVAINYSEFLYIDSTSDGQTGVNVKGTAVSITDKYEMEFRLKRASGTVNVNVQTGNYRLNLAIRDNKIDTWDGSQHHVVKELDIDDQEYHVYKVVVIEDRAYIYMDNAYLGWGVCEVSSTIAQNSPVRIYTSLSGSEVRLRYFKFADLFEDDLDTLNNWDIYDTDGVVQIDASTNGQVYLDSNRGTLQTGINLKQTVSNLKDEYVVEFGLKINEGSTGTATINFQTGKYRLTLSIYSNYINTWTGIAHHRVATTPTSNEWRNFRIIVVKDKAYVYMDGEYIGYGICQESNIVSQNTPVRIYVSNCGSKITMENLNIRNLFTDEYDDLVNWDAYDTDGTVEINPTGQLYLKANNNGQTGVNIQQSVLAISDEYVTEFKLKRISGSTTMNVQTGNYRLNLTIRDNRIDTWTGLQHHIVKTMSIDNDWHVYRVAVIGDRAYVYLDDEYIGYGLCEQSTTIAQNSPLRIYLSTSGSEIRLDYLNFRN